MKTWRDAVIDKSKKMQNAWELMDKTGMAAATADLHSNASTKLCSITCVMNLLHSKPRSDLRLQISEAAAKREKAVQDGKLAMAIKSNNRTASILLQ